jgi:hypothetical protein
MPNMQKPKLQSPIPGMTLEAYNEWRADWYEQAKVLLEMDRLGTEADHGVITREELEPKMKALHDELMEGHRAFCKKWGYSDETEEEKNYVSRTESTTLTCWFAHPSFRNAISSSRPKTWLAVTGNLATEMFCGPGLAGDPLFTFREAAGDFSQRL